MTTIGIMYMRGLKMVKYQWTLNYFLPLLKNPPSPFETPPHLNIILNLKMLSLPLVEDCIILSYGLLPVNPVRENVGFDTVC
jgi:hypothetical protein